MVRKSLLPKYTHKATELVHQPIRLSNKRTVKTLVTTTEHLSVQSTSSCVVCVPLSPTSINVSRWEQKPVGMVKHDPKWLVNCNGLLLGKGTLKWSKAGWWRSTGVHHDKSSKDIDEVSHLHMAHGSMCCWVEKYMHIVSNYHKQKTILQWLFTKFLWPWWLNIIIIIRNVTAMIHHNLFDW